MQTHRQSAKWSLFAVLAAMTAFVAATNERFFLDHRQPSFAYYQPILGWIVPHGLAGLLALGAGALQFSTRLRTRLPRIHRMVGYAYIAGVSVSAVLSLVITSLHNELPLRVTIFVQSSLWIAATGTAYYCIRHRRIDAHREWMMRSYAITLIFLVNRVVDAVPALGALDTGSNPSMLWICNLLAWVVPSFIVGWPRIRHG